ncbi:MAG: hypothetical protein CMC18_07815 [Flavobacteriaceae bacterium]|nr:hypothetical protein [Flavobacteriaceae bacterium]
MRKSFLLLGFLFTTLWVSAQEKAEIQFKEETIDYGKINRGSNGLRVFEFTNTGDAPLVITNVRSSCGCTIPKKPEESILPGQQGKIEVEYDTNRAAGPFRKAITVSSNASNPTKILKIKGELIEK